MKLSKYFIIGCGLRSGVTYTYELLQAAGLDIGYGGDLVKPNAQGFDMEHGDAMKLPGISRKAYDFVYSSHTLEHMPNPDIGLLNWWDCVKPGGFLILTVWNLNPLRMILIRKWKRFLSFAKFTILKISGKSKLDFKDFYIPWRNICLRYVHYFTKGEIKTLTEKSDFKVKEVGVLENLRKRETNIYLIAEK